jgi:small subunit ribosomal protein S6
MVKKQENHLYEGMYILSTSLSDDARQKAIDKIIAGITQRGGEIHKQFDQGRKRLAYEINKRREGHYVIIFFSLPSQAMTELWRDYNLNEDMVRFSTLQIETVPETLSFKQLPHPGMSMAQMSPMEAMAKGQKEAPFSKKRKSCPFKEAGFTRIDYKDLDTLTQFISERGKIVPGRISGVSTSFQRQLASAIKQARYMALLPFVATI